MKNNIFFNENCVEVELTADMKEDCHFLDSYENTDSTYHDLEYIVGEFSLGGLNHSEIYRDPNKYSIINMIKKEFISLEYPPCRFSIQNNKVRAEWYVPMHYLIRGLSSSEIDNLMTNLKKQLEEINMCELIKLYQYGGDRKIPEGLYFENYYRKTKFEKLITKKINGKCVYANFVYNLSGMKDYDKSREISFDEIVDNVKNDFKNLTYPPTELIFTGYYIYGIWVDTDQYIANNIPEHEVLDGLTVVEKQISNLQICDCESLWYEDYNDFIIKNNPMDIRRIVEVAE
jgi:hypothetical protein